MTIELNGERGRARRAGDRRRRRSSAPAPSAERRGVAVAVDGEVVPRSAWDATTLADGQRVEVVGAIQGG